MRARGNEPISHDVLRYPCIPLPISSAVQATGGSRGLERVFEIGPAFRAEKHDTYRHLNEFVSFDIEAAWCDDEDVMGVLERMIHSIWSRVAADDQDLVDIINAYRHTQGLESVVVEVPELPFPRIPYDDAIEIVKQGGGDIEWGDDIESHHCDLIASNTLVSTLSPDGYVDETVLHPPQRRELGSTGSQLSRGFDLNYGRDEMTSGGQREHRVEVLEQNLRDMDLDPDDFSFYTDGFDTAHRHAGWGTWSGSATDGSDWAGNVREVVLFPRDRSRVTP